jgi:hypothetical protein
MTTVLCSGEFKNEGGKCHHHNSCMYYFHNQNLLEEVTGHNVGGVVLPAEKGCNKTPTVSGDSYTINTASEELMYSVLCTLREEEGLDFPEYPPTKKQLRRIWAVYFNKERREYILEIIEEYRDGSKNHSDGREIYQFKLMQDVVVYCDANLYNSLFNAQDFSDFLEIFYSES